MTGRGTRGNSNPCEMKKRRGCAPDDNRPWVFGSPIRSFCCLFGQGLR